MLDQDIAETLAESASVPQPPTVKDYEVEVRGSTNGRILDRYLRYRFRLIGVENGLIRDISKMFRDAFDSIDTYITPKNPEILKLLSDARLFPSLTPLKETDDIPALTTQAIVEATTKGGKSPLAPSKISSIVSYLLQAIQDRLNGPFKRIVDSITTVAADIQVAEPQIVASITNSVLSKSVKDKLPGGVLITAEPPVKRITSLLLNPLGGPRHEKAMEKRYGDALDKIKKTLTVGLIQGKGIGTLRTEIRGVLNIHLANRAGIIARTELQRTAAEANRALYLANTDVLKAELWIGTLDIDLCLLCFNLDGRKFAVGKGPQPIDDTHPNCRCLRAPVTKSWRELGLDMDEAPMGDRASMNGLVPGRITAAMWFEKQPVSFKQELLGKKRYQYYKDGELKLKQFASNKKIYTLAQLRTRYGIEDEEEV